MKDRKKIAPPKKVAISPRPKPKAKPRPKPRHVETPEEGLARLTEVRVGMGGDTDSIDAEIAEKISERGRKGA